MVKKIIIFMEKMHRFSVKMHGFDAKMHRFSVKMHGFGAKMHRFSVKMHGFDAKMHGFYYCTAVACYGSIANMTAPRSRGRFQTCPYCRQT
jgi:hypothetical protein